MTTMQAAVVRRFGEPLEIEEVSVPTPGPGEVLVKVVASGLCHTDLHAADGDWPVKPAPPFIPGHEAAGFVAAVGAGVTDLKAGDVVGAPWLHDACGCCEHCVDRWETLCEQQHNTGYSVNGGFADYVLADARFVARLNPASDLNLMAPILCAGVTTYKALRETEARPGQWVAISGIGGLGHIAIQYAKAMGLHVVAVDVDKAKLDLALSVGADAVVDARSGNAAESVRTTTGGGAHGVVVTAVSPSAFSEAIGMARRRGTVALVGLPPGEFGTPIFDVVLKRITVRGSIVGTRRDMAEAIAFAEAGLVRPQIEVMPLTEINTAIARLRRGEVAGRIVLRPE